MGGVLDPDNIPQAGGNDIIHALEGKTGWQHSATHALHDFLFGGGGGGSSDDSTKTEDKKPSKKKDDPKKKTEAKPVQEPDPWAQLAQQLVGQLQQEQAPMEAAISGALTQPAAATALGIADQAVGISPTSSTGEWLQQQVSKGATEMDPLQQALNAYGSAYGAANVGVDQALVNMGKANDAAVNTAGEQPFLNALVSHLGQGGWGYTIQPSQAAELPAAVKQALTAGGWQVDSASTSKTADALTGLPTPAAAQQAANPTAPYSGTSVTG